MNEDENYIYLDPKSIWECIGDDLKIQHYCQNEKNSEFFTEYHETYNLTILQWLLWYIGSGTRTFNQVKKNSKYSRKDWAFHKLKLIYENLPVDIWRTLVHTPTGFSKKCYTIHFFTRNSYKLNKEHLDKVNEWLDKVDGRFHYKSRKDEYGYTPGQYIIFHSERKERFEKKGKTAVDKLMMEYHELEKEFSDEWISTLEFLDTEKDNYFDWLKEIGGKKEICLNLPVKMRKLILKICKNRIESHLIHDKIFQDELAEVEKMEEKSNRNLTQNSNHLWIIKTYQMIIAGSFEAEMLDNFIKLKKVELH